MTKLFALTLLAALAATPSLAQNAGDSRNSRADPSPESFSADRDGDTDVRTVPRRSSTRSLRLTNGVGGDPLAMTVSEASDWADTVCGGDSILYFDIDENGDPVESSYNFDCMDDL